MRGLEVKNFIKRVRSINERSKNPQLTELGLEALNKALPAVEKTDGLFFRSLTQDELELLLNLFQKILTR